ncbi:probable ribosome-binding factor A, chloroplastic [Ricinus communis]|uniref:Ribosome-binding factor A, putative n=1 Tax=Ricinus communis TaxID=3988 RepID=B9RG62_RICCO|nr:probable ribosome-binding factor A, chloroplastic [Ricinus communis]EEF49517.1 Ribosome-binding factor A, putative [Ricinus communis]|eukprot:XP_002513014.1 probable ribosome-binding factor A, chloroplastic [Ricinus communis]
MLHLHLRLHFHQPVFTSQRNSPPITTILHNPFPIWTPKSAASAHLRQKPFINTIKCMANPRRVKMVAKQIQRELSDMLLTDKVLQYAILPEAALGADKYLSSLTTISDVEVSTDLQVVKVYVSVFGDDRGKEVAIAGLKAKAKYVRSELGRRMKLRLTPEIRFIEDESFERGSRVLAILDKIKAEKENTGSEDELSESSDSPQDDRDWEGDDPDEGIIYVK